MAAMISRESRKTIREDASTSHSQPLASTRAVGSQRSTSQHPPVPCSPTASRLPQPTGIMTMAAMISRESRRTIREDASTNHSSPLASTRAAGSQQSPPVWRRPPTARLAAPTHQNHGTAARISRQTDRTIREDASTNHSSPLASTRAVASLPFTLMSCPPAAR